MRARTFVVALLGMMVLTAVGCGSGGGKDDSGDGLTFWTAEDNPDRVKATQAIVDRFQQQTNIKVKLVAIGEDQLASQVSSASAAGTLPDVLAAASLGFVHSLAADNITDPDAAAAVINTLGPETFPGGPSAWWRPTARRWPSPATAGPSCCSTARTCSTRPAWPPDHL